MPAWIFAAWITFSVLFLRSTLHFEGFGYYIMAIGVIEIIFYALFTAAFSGLIAKISTFFFRNRLQRER